jgi:peptidoglycan hydrolase-like protein with peptidoglycan-binding domain
VNAALPIMGLFGLGAALALSATRASPPPGGGAAPGPAPAPAPKAGAVTLDSQLPPTLETQVLQALATSKDPNELDALAAQLESKGFPLAASALRARAAQLRVIGTTATATDPPAASATAAAATPPTALPGLDPGIDAATGQAVLTALTTETDPASLVGFVHQIQDKYPLAAQALLTKAAGLQAVVHANEMAAAAAANVQPTAVPPVVFPSNAASPPVVAPSATSATFPPGTAPAWAPTVTPGAAHAPAPSAAPAASGPGSWVLATDGDVARDGLAPRYMALLSQPVGTQVEELHNGRRWELRVLSKTTDPNLTTYAKDVKGWIWRPSAAGGAATATAPIVPPLVPVVTSKTMAAVTPSSSVRTVQHVLNALGVVQPPLVEDGINGPKTIGAIKIFQTSHGLAVDGIVGPLTQAALTAAYSAAAGPLAPALTALAPAGGAAHLPPPPPPASAPPVATVPPVVTLKDVQHALNLLGASPALAEDGINGPKTMAAVRAFQSNQGLVADAVAGPKTKAALHAALALAQVTTSGWGRFAA